MKMLASPGGKRAALITAMTYARNFTFANHTSVSQCLDLLAQPSASKYPRR